MVIKLLLFARDVFEVLWNIFLYFFDTPGLSFKTFDSKESAKIPKPAQRGLDPDEADCTTPFMNNIVVSTSNEFLE